MLVRTLAALAIVAAIQNAPLLAQQDEASPKVGDRLFIRMTGDLAKQYVRCTGRHENEPPFGLAIETTATVAHNLDDGRIRIEHSSSIERDGKPPRLVTLTGIVDPTRITTEVVPKGTAIYASPAAHKSGVKPTLTKQDAKTLRLHLSDLKGIKLPDRHGFWGGRFSRRRLGMFRGPDCHGFMISDKPKVQNPKRNYTNW